MRRKAVVIILGFVGVIVVGILAVNVLVARHINAMADDLDVQERHVREPARPDTSFETACLYAKSDNPKKAVAVLRTYPGVLGLEDRIPTNGVLSVRYRLEDRSGECVLTIENDHIRYAEVAE